MADLRTELLKAVELRAPEWRKKQLEDIVAKHGHDEVHDELVQMAEAFADKVEEISKLLRLRGTELLAARIKANSGAYPKK